MDRLSIGLTTFLRCNRAEAGAFPAGLPVGIVRLNAQGTPEVELFARVDRLDVVRLFDYGLRGIIPPEAVARPEPRPGRR